MDSSEITLNTDSRSQRDFCALEYRTQSAGIGVPRNASVILLVLRNNDGSLRFLIHPELRNIYQGKDLEYLDSLLWDFVERARLYPDELFKQLSTLSDIGPLATHQAGLNIADYPALAELAGSFVEL